MFQESRSNSAEENPKNPPENEDLTIMITQFRTPQEFSYVKCKDVKVSAFLVRMMEHELPKYCTKVKHESIYQIDQSVIVLYKPVSPHKLLRGVVKKREDEEYVVWILDYGFTLSCSLPDMWPLEDSLTRSFWQILDGGMAYICPRNGNWSQSALRIFDKLMEDAVQLQFKDVYVGQENRHFGKLMFRLAGENAALQDGAKFLLGRKQACPQPSIKDLPPTSSSEAFCFELAEINDPMIEARPRVKEIFKLVASSCDPSSPYPTHMQEALNDVLVQLVSQQKPIYNNISFDIAKVLGKSETWSDASKRKLSRPSERVEVLDESLELRPDIRVPYTGRYMRSKAGSCASKESSVQTALTVSSIPNNPSNVKINDDSSSPETDKDSPLGVEFWKENLKLPSRSPSPSASSEESFHSVIKYTDDSSSIASLDEFLPMESGKDSTGSLSLYESLELPKSGPWKTTSASQNVTEKSKAVAAISLPSAKEGSSSVPSPSINPNIYSVDKLLPICNRILASKNHIPHITAEDLQNRAVFAVNKASALESKPKNMTKNSAVLAHSVQPVNPASSLDELLFATEIRRNMSDLNINSMLPTQKYAWPHLLNGGSLALINSCGLGRSWSYLPALCSSVWRSLQSSLAVVSRGPKLGPLAILLVDSISRANALAGNCDSLMTNSDPLLLKVVNTQAHSMRSCQLMLLNSCGILVTTPDHLLVLLGHEIPMIDAKRLEYFVFDDFDRLRQTTPELLAEVLQKLEGMTTSPSMQLVVVAQQWHAKVFGKLLRHMPKPLALFGDFLEAAMYGGLTLKFSLKAEKKDLLLKFLAEQKDSKKRTLICCGHERELKELHGILTRAGHECVGLARARSQQPHQLLLVSDHIEELQLEVRNIQVLIHFSLPQSWSKFVSRFHVMADQIPNYFKKEENKPSLLSYLLLDRTNAEEFKRLTMFLSAHGIRTEENPWMNCQSPSSDSIPYCPYLLRSGECLVPCHKRHYFTPADKPTPGNPLQQPGTVIRCKLYKAYDPAHMAVWPLEYQTQGSSVWLDTPYPVKKWTLAVEMNMATNREVHSPCCLGDVCIINHKGHFKRVAIVDMVPRGPVTVQMMDYGTELLHVHPNHLLRCPEDKLRTLPPLAMDIRLAGVIAGEDKWSADTTQWVEQSFGSINERQHLQITVDFAMLNVVYVKDVTLVEECPAMRTSVYKLMLRQELHNRGIGQVDNQGVRQFREMREEQKKANEELEGNKEKTQEVTKKSSSLLKTKAYPSPPKTEPKPLEKPFQTKPELARGDGKSKELPCKEGTIKADTSKELPCKEGTIKADTSKENIDPSCPEAGHDQASTSSAALYKALLHELYTTSPSKKKVAHQFLQSILERDEKPAARRELKLEEDAPQAAIRKELKLEEDAPQGATRKDLKLEDAPQALATKEPSDRPVTQSLQYSTIYKGAVRPRVKWYQTSSHIYLSIEQQVKEYHLFLNGTTLIYSSSSSSPPRHCVLPLLCEVRLESQKQHGFSLKIKLAKVGTLAEWPTLLASVYAQKHSPWLTYDMERAEEPLPPPSLLLWERYSRHVQMSQDNCSSEDEDEEAWESVDSPTICEDI